MKWITRIITLSILGLAPIAAAGQGVDHGERIREDRAQPWRVTSYLEDAGLQGSAVFVIDFEADGTVWIAASDGLYRYDGYRWTRYTTADGLPSSYVRTVLVTRGGELWVGTDHGAGVFDGKTFDPRSSPDHLAGPSVRRIVEDPDGTLWFSCDQWPPGDVQAGLSRYRDGTWKSWHTDDGLPSDYVSDVFRTREGEHYVLTRNGLARFDGERLDRPIEDAGLGECRDYIWSMAETPEGHLVVATHAWFCIRRDGRWFRVPNESPRILRLTTTGDGTVLACTGEPRATFVEWKDDRFVPIWTTPLDTRGGVQYIAEGPDGAIWVGGTNLLARWERTGGEWRSLDDLPGPQLRDAQGGVWFADADRVLRTSADAWTRFPDAFGPVIRDSSTGVWMHTSSGMARWSPEGFTRFSERTIGVAHPREPSVDGAGQLWVVGTGPDGRDRPARFDGKNWTATALTGIKPTESVVFGTPDSGPGMWYVLRDSEADRYRLVRVDGAAVLGVPLPMEATRYWMPRVQTDRAGRLWLFGMMGLYRRNPDTDSPEWLRITELPGRQVQNVVTRGDEVWISYLGTTGGSGGVSLFLDESWTHFLSPARSFTAKDVDGTLFFTHPRGVSIVPPDSASAPRLLAIPESTWVESMVSGPDQSLWIGTAGRVFHYRPDGIPPETMILHGKQEILHREDLVLEVRGVERFKPLTRPGNFNVAVQVDDQPWGEFEPLADGRVTIDNLSTGDHVVRVRVQDQGGDVDPTPAEWRFRLHTVPLQDRAWFPPLALGIFLTFLLLAGLSIVARRRELRQRTRKQELEHEILEISEREQRRIGRDLHDGLGQRLTSISFQCEGLRAMLDRGDASSSSERAKEIGAAVRTTISEAKGLAHALYPAEIDRGNLETALGNLVASVVRGFRGTCTYHCYWSSEELSREDSLNLYRIVQEALGNAIRHAEAETVNVELRQVDGKRVLEVRDDGCGFDAGHAARGLGLQIMHYRADLIGGTLTVDSHPGKGTTIRCELG